MVRMTKAARAAASWRMSPQARRVWTPVLLTLGFVASAFIGLHLVRYPSGAPADWMASSFLVCILLMSTGRRRLAAALACVAANVAIAMLAHWPMRASVLFSVLTLAEAVVAAWLVRRVIRAPRLINLKQAVLLIVLVIAPAAAVSALLAGALAKGIVGYGFTKVFLQWFAGHGVGMLMTLPTLLILATPTRSPAPRRGKIENALLAATAIFFSVGVFTPLSMVTFLLILPAATVFAFRLGLKPTVIGVVFLDALSEVLAYALPNPNLWGPTMKMETLIVIGQVYYSAVYLNGLLTGLAVDYQSRIKSQLEHRTAIARKARARAARASRAKTEFLATMSHEIRTPLNGVVGFTQVLMKSDQLAPRDRRQVALIDASGRALLTVVNDILDFSKVEAGEVTLDPRPVRVADVAGEVVAISRPEAERKGLEISLVVAGAQGLVHSVDDQRLKQVLFNLLNNAIKFTSQGGVTVLIDLSQDAVRCEVRDTGQGISADALPRLFRRFSQADGSISRRHGGTGLGLAICKGLVELMGGRIGVDSAVGEGSCFWFEISPPVAEHVLAACETSPAAEVRAHVLLVDDHPVNRQLGVTVLELLGCTADTVENGLEAIEAVREGQYDLVLMDLHMPVMDGIEATRAIRQLEGPAAGVPIISMSADVMEDQTERCLAAGMNDSLSKPIEIGALQACIALWAVEPKARGEIAA